MRFPLDNNSFCTVYTLLRSRHSATFANLAGIYHALILFPRHAAWSGVVYAAWAIHFFLPVKYIFLLSDLFNHTIIQINREADVTGIYYILVLFPRNVDWSDTVYGAWAINFFPLFASVLERNCVIYLIERLFKLTVKSTQREFITYRSYFWGTWIDQV